MKVTQLVEWVDHTQIKKNPEIRDQGVWVSESNLAIKQYDVAQ